MRVKEVLLQAAAAVESNEVDKKKPEARGPTQADVLIKLAETAALFRNADGIGFADLHVNGHRETHPLRSKGFRRWLFRQFFAATRGAPNAEAFSSALNVIEAKAHFDCPERPVNIRVAALEGRVYIDLADASWRAIEIDATGWRIVASPPVRFRRAAGMLALPSPLSGGSIETMRPFLNVKSNEDFILAVAWLLAALRDCGPYPVLVLSGEHGAAKSTFAKILRSLVDPSTTPLRALPREDRDLFIAASNGHLLAFDNVSGLPAWISDTLCRLATGGGFATRQLYSDQDEMLFDATRPIILNGIEDVVARPDLADRSLFLTLEPIPEKSRLPEARLWADFERHRPEILGALLDAMVMGLRLLPTITLRALPRMADFALWASACEAALWKSGTFMQAYRANLDEIIDNVLEADPVAVAVRTLIFRRTEWTGTSTSLLGALDQLVSEATRKAKTWPSKPSALSGRLRRCAPFLRKTGIDITFAREGKGRDRIITIERQPESGGIPSSALSAPSALKEKFNNGNGVEADGPADANGTADTNAVRLPVRPKSLETNAADAADAADAKIPLLSGSTETDEDGSWTE